MGLQHPDHRFKSDRRLIFLSKWRHGQAVKTSPFHGGITGSIPVGVMESPIMKGDFLIYIISGRVIMMTGKTRKIAAIIAIVLVVAMILGMCLVYFHI